MFFVIFLFCQIIIVVNNNNDNNNDNNNNNIYVQVFICIHNIE